jgi:hypothetical protein
MVARRVTGVVDGPELPVDELRAVFGADAAARDATPVVERVYEPVVSATIAAKYAWILPAMSRGAAEHRELLNRRPIEETFRHWAPAIPFLLDRADEARELA